MIRREEDEPAWPCDRGGERGTKSSEIASLNVSTVATETCLSESSTSMGAERPPRPSSSLPDSLLLDEYRG